MTTDESDRAPEPVALDAWRAEAGACAPLDAAATRGPWRWDHRDYLVVGESDDAVLWPNEVWHDTLEINGTDADKAFTSAARTGWPRDAARVGVLCERVAAWRTYALAVNVLRLSEGCVEEEEYARLHEEHDRAWQAVLAVEPEAAKR